MYKFKSIEKKLKFETDALVTFKCTELFITDFSYLKLNIRKMI